MLILIIGNAVLAQQPSANVPGDSSGRERLYYIIGGVAALTILIFIIAFWYGTRKKTEKKGSARNIPREARRRSVPSMVKNYAKQALAIKNDVSVSDTQSNRSTYSGGVLKSDLEQRYAKYYIHAPTDSITSPPEHRYSLDGRLESQTRSDYDARSRYTRDTYRQSFDPAYFNYNRGYNEMFSDIGAHNYYSRSELPDFPSEEWKEGYPESTGSVVLGSRFVYPSQVSMAQTHSQISLAQSQISLATRSQATGFYSHTYQHSDSEQIPYGPSASASTHNSHMMRVFESDDRLQGSSSNLDSATSPMSDSAKPRTLDFKTGIRDIGIIDTIPDSLFYQGVPPMTDIDVNSSVSINKTSNMTGRVIYPQFPIFEMGKKEDEKNDHVILEMGDRISEHSEINRRNSSAAELNRISEDRDREVELVKAKSHPVIYAEDSGSEDGPSSFASAPTLVGISSPDIKSGHISILQKLLPEINETEHADREIAVDAEEKRMSLDVTREGLQVRNEITSNLFVIDSPSELEPNDTQGMVSNTYDVETCGQELFNPTQNTAGDSASQPIILHREEKLNEEKSAPDKDKISLEDSLAHIPSITAANYASIQDMITENKEWYL